MYVTTELVVVKDGASVRGRTPAGGGEGSALVRYQTPLVARRAGDAARRLPGRRGRLRGGRCSAGSPASRGNVSTVRGDFAMNIPAKVHGEAALDGDRHGISKGHMVVIPPGTEHDAINASITEPLRLYIFYSPPDSASSPVTVREARARAPSPTGRSGVRSLPTRVKIVSKDDAAMQDHRKHDAEHLAMAAGHGGTAAGRPPAGTPATTNTPATRRARSATGSGSRSCSRCRWCSTARWSRCGSASPCPVLRARLGPPRPGDLHLPVGRLAVPEGWLPGGPPVASGHDAPHLDGHHGGLRGKRRHHFGAP
jgi:hypothetical protein